MKKRKHQIKLIESGKEATINAHELAIGQMAFVVSPYNNYDGLLVVRAYDNIIVCIDSPNITWTCVDNCPLQVIPIESGAIIQITVG